MWSLARALLHGRTRDGRVGKGGAASAAAEADSAAEAEAAAAKEEAEEAEMEASAKNEKPAAEEKAEEAEEEVALGRRREWVLRSWVAPARWIRLLAVAVPMQLLCAFASRAVWGSSGAALLTQVIAAEQ